MRVLVVSPPPGVLFAVQRGRTELLVPSIQDAEFIQFDFSLRLGPPLPDGTFNFLGEYAQGSPSDRFVYINSGTAAGQAGSCWSRRAKLKLASVPRQIAEAAIGSHECAVEARVLGTMRDGGPICASVKPHVVTWGLVHNVA
jgi:Family of unknown function (DUF5990)